MINTRCRVTVCKAKLMVLAVGTCRDSDRPVPPSVLYQLPQGALSARFTAGLLCPFNMQRGGASVTTVLGRFSQRQRAFKRDTMAVADL